MPTFVGLDCGGSSSRVIAADHLGHVLFQGQSGGANLASTPEKVISANLRKAAEGCPSADYVCGCFAGLLTVEDRERALFYLSHAFPGAHLKAEPDYAAALYATNTRPDICVISGTGSLVCSERNGVIHKSGGGGYVLGDFGSAYQIGKEGLQEYLFGLERPSKRLEEAIMQLFGSSEPNLIIAKFYKIASPAAHVAKLTKVIGHDALEGKDYAMKIIDRNMEKLADIVKRHYLTNYPQTESSGDSSLSILLAGGVWKAGQVFKDTFLTLIEERFLGMRIQSQLIDQPPVRGALRLAMELRNGH